MTPWIEDLELSRRVYDALVMLRDHWMDPDIDAAMALHRNKSRAYLQRYGINPDWIDPREAHCHHALALEMSDHRLDMKGDELLKLLEVPIISTRNGRGYYTLVSISMNPWDFRAIGLHLIEFFRYPIPLIDTATEMSTSILTPFGDMAHISASRHLDFGHFIIIMR